MRPNYFCHKICRYSIVIAEMEINGLKQKEDGLEIYVMIEIPANVLLLAKISFSLKSDST